MPNLTALPTHLPPDVNLCRAKASVDIAELCETLPNPSLEEDVHIINITTRLPLTVNEFKQMFYSRGDGQFSPANVYPCSSYRWINYSVWGITGEHHLYNFNRLGGRENNPYGVFSPYIYEEDQSKTFLAQIDVMANIEKDICEDRKNWTMCTRAGIFDALYNLGFAPEKFSSPCLRIKCARSWEELTDALFDNAVCRGTKIKDCDYLNFYINIKIDSCHECVKPTILRIRFNVQTIKVKDDFYNNNPGWIWSTQPALSPPNFTAADGVLQSGVILDAPEGGKQQEEDGSVLN